MLRGESIYTFVRAVVAVASFGFKLFQSVPTGPPFIE
jgi:hypothetical protein